MHHFMDGIMNEKKLARFSGNRREPAYTRNTWYRDPERYRNGRVGRPINSALGLSGSQT